MRSLFSLFETLGRRRRLQFLGLVLALVVAAFAEMAKIGAVLPVIAIAASPARVPSGPFRDFVRALGAGDPLLVAAAILIVTASLAVVTRLVLAWLTHRFIMSIGQDISEQIFARTLRQPYQAYKSRSSSEILTGLEKARTVIFFVLLPATQGLTAAIVGLTIVLFLLVIDPVMTSIVTAGMMGIFLAAHLTTRRLLDTNSYTMATSATTKTAIVQEALGNIRDILIDRTQPVFEQGFREIDAQLRKAQSVNMLIVAGPRAFIEAAAIIVLAAAALLAAGQPGGVVGALPTLGALALGAQRLLPLLQQAYSGWAQVAANVHSVADVVALLRMPASFDSDDSPTDAEPLGTLVLSNVSFGFSEAAPVLCDINLHIPRGAHVGIVGESGSGKSTLLDVIMGLLTPTSGTISIGGEPLDRRLRARWQSRIAHVPQSIYLSDASISSNIAFGVPAAEIDHERVAEAARTAQAATFIEGLASGYDTRVGEGGARLSGGERQRIGLARALYKRADVLILDEATSALTETMEAAVLDALARQNRTLIMVSHRPSSLQGCDVIVRIKDGEAQTITVRASSTAAPAASDPYGEGAPDPKAGTMLPPA